MYLVVRLNERKVSGQAVVRMHNKQHFSGGNTPGLQS